MRLPLYAIEQQIIAVMAKLGSAVSATKALAEVIIINKTQEISNAFSVKMFFIMGIPYRSTYNSGKIITQAKSTICQ